MNEMQKKVTARIVMILALALMLMFFYGCQIEFTSDCDDQNKYWLGQRDQELKELWMTCPDKCDFGAEEKIIYKKYQNKLQDCE